MREHLTLTISFPFLTDEALEPLELSGMGRNKQRASRPHASKAPLPESIPGRLSREEDGKGAPVPVQQVGIPDRGFWVHIT